MFQGKSSWWPLAAVLVVLAALLVTLQAGAGSTAGRPGTGPVARFGFPSRDRGFCPRRRKPRVSRGRDRGIGTSRFASAAGFCAKATSYHLWYTGYDGTREGVRLLGYATSPDGLAGRRWPGNPLCPGPMGRGHDGRQTRRYLLHVRRGIARRGTTADLEGSRALAAARVRSKFAPPTGMPLSPGPFGTPTAWLENGHLVLVLRADGRGRVAGHVARSEGVDQCARRVR